MTGGNQALPQALGTEESTNKNQVKYEQVRERVKNARGMKNIICLDFFK